MTICLATDSFPPHNSGIATHNLYQAKILTEAGYKLVVVTADFENRKKEDSIEEQSSLTIVTLRKSYSQQYDHYSRFIKNGNREAAVWISFGMAVRKWLLENKLRFGIDIIECCDYGGWGIFLIDELLPPVIVMCHGLLTQMDKYEYHNQDENLWIIRFLETNLVQQADAVTCHSRMNADDIQKDFKAETMYATAPWIHDEIVTTPRINNEFLVISRFAGHKGALVMAEVMNLLYKDHPGIRLTWVGSDSYTAPEGWIVSRYIKKHFPSIWQKTFIWKKGLPRNEAMKLLDASETVIIPSPWETFNYVALEAANRKKALIVTRQAGIAEMLRNEEEMLLTDARDISGIKEAMIRLYNDKELAKRLGENLYRSTGEIFRKQNFLNDRKLVYEKAIEKRNHRNLINPLQSFFN